MNVLLIILHFMSAMAMILFVLLHAGRGGGLSDMFGGAAGGGGAMAGSTVVEKNLDRITVTVAVVFTFTTIILALRLS